MRIGGLIKFSLIDYPGKMAAVIFTQGCNLRCPFCHNPELVVPELFHPSIPEIEIFEFLKKRQKQLEGVVVTGGEPTIHEDLISFLDKINQMGYLVKLDTNGTNPRRLKIIINLKLINYIAMDVKAPLEKYPILVGRNINTDLIKESIDIILSSSIAYEFRTTLVKSLLGKEDISRILVLIEGAERYFLNPFISRESILDKTLLEKESYTGEEIEGFQWSLVTRL